ncbi:defender against cell death 1 protein [Magnaporthiopsis poae ATCC 64411]|uniref:Dolichyl-diphosphooligosaccharide--protein glycosyltransferase subunit OST2 n=1 Tax=Magnaporthiopsis poae (strain ATCC 64411 / 73-15) TaxID=644358 RepID=A0A0C4DRW1_MAGP6|nr:defender against cell death 1 protein [Magnaporthiopsis poae ATCC 64411]
MAPKRNANPSAKETTVASPAPAAAAPAAAAPSKSAKGTPASSRQGWDQIANNVVGYYQKSTPQRTKLIDVFLAFLVVVGALQFLYCILAGNYPFNAFLSGFSATVGQFVLTVSLRIQANESNASDFPSISPERAFADYVVGSLILHFFCVNFIN